MRSNKPFDAPASESEVKLGLATIIGKMVLEAKRDPDIEDIDDASEEAGKKFLKWMEILAYDKNFNKEINQIVGGEFNSEFFADGLNS